MGTSTDLKGLYVLKEIWRYHDLLARVAVI
jgi:hypothetical protein